ncbi:hypothetical protein J4N45_14610 [Vibrio sp. SCSIO 43140]|uniref:hypothetical protein n=1 Tax=Vibrio sp. SCSIO 43140 TaxID=2819100 RepID=UPI002074B5E4|nr:hypothetical protein [Vibrio sp. SCSIO 43140]USD59732.1 hypothetical protein J4N45_14610 [Vibrio sp. SCSIO 43140]
MKIKGDWLRLNCTSFNGALAQRSFKSSLKEFMAKGEVSDPIHMKVIETHLSEKSKALLRARTIVLDRKTMNDISNEILQGVRYPTPHAFRHIWAEAVLTRYQGDIGTVIRHQFCHLDASFFMSYLRDKEASSLIRGAKQRYLNAIVDTLLVESDKIGEDYVGGFTRYVQKAKELTKPLTENEALALRESINGRIIDLQTNIFATCIPREGAENKAKCATFERINPHDAKPEFCLNCTHAIVTKGNIRGIWVTILPMVKEALDDKTLGFMVQDHLPTLRSAYKRIKDLRSSSPTPESVDQILSKIFCSINAIEQKLEEEMYRYD